METPGHGAGDLPMIKKRFFKTKSDCEVSFEFAPDTGSRVDLVCDANGWEPVEMKKNKSGLFRTKMRFPKESVVQFRYLVDSTHWHNDEEADDSQLNRFGGKNSILKITPQA
jgi:1,4-alpha-glucan branching enzyme